LKAVVEEFLSRGEYAPEEEVDALRSELDMVRQHAGTELAALQKRVGEVETENHKLRSETQTLKTQLSVREVAASVAMRESATPERRSIPALLLWPIAAGLLLTTLTLGALFGLDAGRSLLRSWLSGDERPAAQAAPQPATLPPQAPAPTPVPAQPSPPPAPPVEQPG
jgi:hypothetical protein